MSWRGTLITQACTSYRHKNPDVLLLNSTGSTDNKKIKIPGYRVYQANPQGERASGSAIAIKGDLKHKLRPTTAEEMMMIEINLDLDTIIVATHYCPPRRDNAELLEVLTKLASFRQPVYFFGDLNAAHRDFGHRRSNARGRMLTQAISQGLVTHRGPHFHTWCSGPNRSTPDVALTNQAAFHNMTITKGDMGTTSDHIPMEIHLSARPIRIPIKERYAPSKANWDEYRKICEEYVPATSIKEMGKISTEKLQDSRGIFKTPKRL